MIPRLFLGAGLYGIAVLFPMYFLEAQLGQWFPPPITHPELYYGMVGVALAWQVAYLQISRDPARYRPFMLIGAGGKMSFGVATVLLWALSRTPTLVMLAALPDILLAVLFVAAYRVTPEPKGQSSSQA